MPQAHDNQVRNAILQTLAILVFLGFAAWLGFTYFRGPIDAFALWLSSTLGLPGAFLFVYGVDTFIVPMSADILFATASAWDPIPFLLTISLASITGGCTGYWLARLLGKLPFVAKRAQAYKEKRGSFITKYGLWAVILAALTPIPFSLVTWVAGLVKMPFGTYLLGASFRLPRMVLYWLAVQAGIILAT